MAGAADATATPLPDADRRHPDAVDGVHDDDVGEHDIARLCGAHRGERDAVTAGLAEAHAELIASVCHTARNAKA